MLALRIEPLMVQALLAAYLLDYIGRPVTNEGQGVNDSHLSPTPFSPTPFSRVAQAHSPDMKQVFGPGVEKRRGDIAE